MPETINLTSTSHAVVAVLALKGPNREQCVRSLYAGQDMLVGSEDIADLRADGVGIAAMHCLIRSFRGTVSVRDLYSPTGTWVGEQRISEYLVVQNSVVRVGEFTVSITLSELPQTHLSTVPELRHTVAAAPSRSSATIQPFSGQDGISPLDCETRTVRPRVVPDIASHGEQATPEVLVPTAQRDTNAALSARWSDIAPESRIPPEPASPAVACDRTPDGPPEDMGAQTICRLRSQLQQANAEIGALRDRLEFAATQIPPQDADPWQDEMTALLRAEIVELQTALAEKDSESSERSYCSSADEDRTSDSVSPEESERLIERLEHLLLELHQRDEQVGLLNDLLEAAENANRAEQEERQRFNVWVSDIENRIGRQEEEWQAERQKLMANIGRLTVERDRAEATIAADTTMARNEAIQRVMHGLRDEAEALRRDLAQSTAASVQLRRELDEANRKDFREEAVQIAQERAQLARMRHEIEASRQIPVKPVEMSDSNLRFRALREHLNEIHDKEKHVRVDAKLGSRISRLWSLLDGRKS